jgi:hypothetical protein
MKQVPRRNGVRRVGLVRGRLAPRVLRAGEPRPVERDTEVELHDRTVGVQPGEPVEAVDRLVGPVRERLPDARLDRGPVGELAYRARGPAGAVVRRRAPERAGLAVGADAQLERERRRAGPRRGAGRGAGGRPGLEGHHAHHRGRRDRGRRGGDGDDARPGRHGFTVAVNGSLYS